MKLHLYVLAREDNSGHSNHLVSRLPVRAAGLLCTSPESASPWRLLSAFRRAVISDPELLDRGELSNS